jgi:hypothetical protein
MGGGSLCPIITSVTSHMPQELGLSVLGSYSTGKCYNLHLGARVLGNLTVPAVSVLLTKVAPTCHKFHLSFHSQLQQPPSNVSSAAGMTPTNHSTALTPTTTTSLFTVLPNQPLLMMKIKSKQRRPFKRSLY